MQETAKCPMEGAHSTRRPLPSASGRAGQAAAAGHYRRPAAGQGKQQRRCRGAPVPIGPTGLQPALQSGVHAKGLESCLAPAQAQHVPAPAAAVAALRRQAQQVVPAPAERAGRQGPALLHEKAQVELKLEGGCSRCSGDGAGGRASSSKQRSPCPPVRLHVLPLRVRQGQWEQASRPQ